MTIRLPLALFLTLLLGASGAQAQATTLAPGPTAGPIPEAPPGRDDYPDPTDVDWGGAQDDPCALPFPLALCDDMTGGGLAPEAGDAPDGGDNDGGGESGGDDAPRERDGFTAAANRVGQEIIRLAEENIVAAGIMWVAETFGPNVPTATTEEATREDLNGGVLEVGGLPAVRSFAAFLDPVKPGEAVASGGRGTRAGLQLHSKWEMNAVDDDEYAVRLTARRARAQVPFWVVARYGRLFIILPERD